MGQVFAKKEEDPRLKKQSTYRQVGMLVGLTLLGFLLLVQVGVTIAQAAIRVQGDPLNIITCDTVQWPTSFTVVRGMGGNVTSFEVVCEWGAGHTIARLGAAVASIVGLIIVMVKMTVRRTTRKIVYMIINVAFILVGVAWCALGGWDAQVLSTSDAFCRGRGFQCTYTVFYSPPAVSFLSGLLLFGLAVLCFFYWRKQDYKRDRVFVHRSSSSGGGKDAGGLELPNVSEDDLEDLPL